MPDDGTRLGRLRSAAGPVRPGRWPHAVDGTLWDGRPDKSLTLLVDAEQGLGDTLQFIRFLKVAAGRVGSVILRPQARLMALLGRMPLLADGAIRLLAPDAPMPEHHRRLPLLSLPGLTGLTPDTVPDGRIAWHPDDERPRAAAGEKRPCR